MKKRKKNVDYMCMLCLSLSNVFINAYRNIFITYHDSFAFSCTYSTYGKDIIHKSTLCVAEMGKYGVFRVRVRPKSYFEYFAHL